MKRHDPLLHGKGTVVDTQLVDSEGNPITDTEIGPAGEAAPITESTQPQPPEPPSPYVVNGIMSLSRRAMLRVLGHLGLWELASQITSGALPGPTQLVMGGLSAHGDERDPLEIEREMAMATQHADELANEIINQAMEKEDEGMSSHEAMMFAIDAAGTANFVMGVRDLLPKAIGPVNIPGSPVGHINSTRYVNMLVLSGLKYVASNAEERHHLEAETISSLKAFGIIAGTIVAAEGLQLDLDKAYEETARRKPDTSDKVAIMNLLGSIVSPTVTTVGSASLIRKMSNDLAKTGEKDAEGKEVIDHDLATVAVSHISDLSGYLLFGDPPFIAVCEKYGFKEGVSWQMNTMWPLALYSLLSATAKMNYVLAKREGLAGAEAWKKAVNDAYEGLRKNVPILASIIGKSLGNFAKYFTGADSLWVQNQLGIQSQIDVVLGQKLAGAFNLVVSERTPAHLHEEEHEGMVHVEKPQVVAVDSVLGKFLTEAVKVNGDETIEGDVHQRLRRAIEEKDFDGMVAAGRELGIPSIEVLVAQWKDFNDNQKLDESVQKDAPPQDFWSRISPEAYYNRSFDVDRIKGYTGHNMGDVVNVFPFQAGSVPFLTPMFKQAVHALESAGLGEKPKEISVFFAIMLFSMMADNYVACKIGLELLPNKPQIPLIASIQGGSMTSIGNMANVAQFNLEDYPLAVSLAKAHWHADDVMIGLAWSQAIEWLNQFGLLKAPAVKGAAGKDQHAGYENILDTDPENPGEEPTTPANVDQKIAMSRRGLFGLFTGGETNV